MAHYFKNGPRIIYKIIFIIFIFLLPLLFTGTLGAVPYQSYNYDFWEEPVAAPQAYVPQRILELNDIADNLIDIFVLSAEEIYLLDSDQGKIIIMDHYGQIIDTLSGFQNGQTEDQFDNPRGIFVTEDREILIADTDNNRIVILDREGELLQILGDPLQEAGMESIIPGDYVFRPLKLGVGLRDRIYVVADRVFDGIMELDHEGVFQNFMGAPEVSPEPWEYFWMRVATEEQRVRRARLVPTEFSSLDIDESGFIYTTSLRGEGEEVVKKMNPAGVDTLRREDFFPVSGDLKYPEDDAEARFEGPSQVIDITARDNGMFSVLDFRRGRVFTYDNMGRLLYIFGGRGEAQGMFTRPSAVASLKDDILVVDSRINRVTVFRPTVYASYIHQAIDYYQAGFFEQSADMWEKVLAHNVNYNQAYSGIARTYYFQDEYEKALKYFRRGHDRDGYSEVFEYYRSEQVTETIGTMLNILILMLAVVFIGIKFSFFKIAKSKISSLFRKKRQANRLTENGRRGSKISVLWSRIQKMLFKNISDLLYARYIIFHPFGGFWDLKRERKVGLLPAAVILGVVCLTYIFIYQYTGFIFNPRDLSEMNVLKEIATVLVPFLLWCMVNWALTTLMDGKGTFKQIYVYSAYALTPLVVLNIPLTVISNYLTQNEANFYYLIFTGAIIWAMALLFFGTIVVHEYTLSKTILTVISIIVGIGTVIFIALLFVMVVSQMFGFVQDIYRELVFRI